MSEVKKRSRKGAIYCAVQTLDDVMDAPNTATDGILAENLDLAYNPQVTKTNEFTNSLDSRPSIIGGFKATASFDVYLKGSGVPGLAPEYGVLLRACGFAETVISTALTGTDIYFDAASGQIRSTTTDLSVLLPGTAIYSAAAEKANTGAFIVTASTATSATVTKDTGAPPALQTTVAGQSVTLLRGLSAAAATSGTDTSATLAAPFAATDQLYRGAPLVLTGNPATPATSFITDYTAARLATLTDRHATALSSATFASIPPSVIYVPASDNIPWVTLWLNMDGVLVKLYGCQGTVSFEVMAGGPGKLKFTMSGLYAEEVDQPLGLTAYDKTRPAIWRDGRGEIDRKRVGMSQLTLDVKNDVVFPENPNGPEGFDPPIIVKRDITGSIDPNLSLVATQNVMAAFRSGETQVIHARLTGGPGAVAGNRVAITVPAALYTDAKPGDRNGVRSRQTPFDATVEDGGMTLAFW